MITVQVQDELYQKAEIVAGKMGFDMPSAIHVFLTQMINDNKFPFTPTADPFYSDGNMQRLRESIAELEETGGTIHDISEFEVFDE